MKKPTKEEIINIAKSLMLEPTDELINEILDEFNALNKRITKMQKIDTNNIKPLSHIDECDKLDFFREDIPNDSFAINKKQILENAFEKDEDYIITNKVVK